MIIPDVNLLLFANNPVAREYTAAQNWMEAVLTGNEHVGFCWPVLCGFLRISTNPRTFLDPLDMETAITLVNDWINRGNVTILNPTENHWMIFTKLLKDAQVRGTMTSDAEIATFAFEYGGVLYTTDRGFSRFPNLKYVNPLGN